jgi:hypothetical protein
LDFLFYNFFCGLLIFKDSAEINKKEKDKTTITLAKPPFKTA